MKGGGGADSYWPGFVDALTNVVIAMIFVVVVLALSVSFAAQLMGKKIAERVIKEHDAAASKTSSPTNCPVASVSDIPKPSKIIVSGDEPPEKLDGGKVHLNNNVIEIDFAGTALTLDSNSENQLKSELGKLGEKLESKHIEILGRGPEMALSENQRAAYMRVLSTRNALLAKGYTAENITVRIDVEASVPKPQVIVSVKN